MYLPVGPVYQAPVAASFVVSELSLGPASPADVAALLTARDDAWQPVTTDGADGVRVERTAGPCPGDGVEFGSRRVDYVVPVPGRPGRWLAVAFSTSGAGDPGGRVAELLTELFDAIMSTLRWDGHVSAIGRSPQNPGGTKIEATTSWLIAAACLAAIVAGTVAAAIVNGERWMRHNHNNLPWNKFEAYARSRGTLAWLWLPR